MATGSTYDSVRLWALPSGRRVGRPLRGAERASLSLSPDGRTLATTRPEAGGVEILDVATLRRRAILPGSEDVWDLIRFTPDGRFLVGGSWKGWAQLWSTKSWKKVGRRFTGHAGRVEAQSVSPDGRTLATSGPDGKILLWDLHIAAAARRRSAGSAEQLRGPAVHTRREVPTRHLRNRWAGLPLGRAPVLLGAACLRRGGPLAHPIRVAGSAARSRLRSGVYALTRATALRADQARVSLVRQRRGRDSNPRTSCPVSGFQDRCIRPLCHPSGDGFIVGFTLRRAGRGGRVAEGTRLLSEYGAESSIAGSNPALSAPPPSSTVARLGGRAAPVAQLDRASVYGTEGQRFESSRARFWNPAGRQGYSPSLTAQRVIVASRLAWLPAAGFCVSTVQLRSHSIIRSWPEQSTSSSM